LKNGFFSSLTTHVAMAAMRVFLFLYLFVKLIAANSSWPIVRVGRPCYSAQLILYCTILYYMTMLHSGLCYNRKSVCRLSIVRNVRAPYSGD